jgi:hypothetical protein
MMTKKKKISDHKNFWKKTLVGQTIKKLVWKVYDEHGSTMISEIHLESGSVLHLRSADAIWTPIK